MYENSDMISLHELAILFLFVLGFDTWTLTPWSWCNATVALHMTAERDKRFSNEASIKTYF